MMKKPTATKLSVKWIPVVLIVLFAIPAFGQDGAELFKVNCSICHKIGGGVLLGPDLANVQMRRDKEWIFSFIRSSTAMINSGDETAVGLFDKYNKIMMPDQPTFTDQDIEAILAYIAAESPEYVPGAETDIASADDSSVEPEIIGKPIDEATEEDIMNGRLLFSGETRLENKGPACLSCHNVLNDKLIGGGLLAKDLTEAFTRLNENGIKAMVSNPPFPAMRKAYGNHPINSDEAYLLTAFLQFADQEQYYQHQRDYKAMFLYAGIIGFVFLLIVFTAIWRNRKSASVNQKIYDRQLKSESYY